MKRNLIGQTLMSLILIVVMLKACIPTALAEDKTLYTVNVDISMYTNFFFARYGVTVSIDDTELGRLPHGERLVKIVELPAGVHTIRLKADDQSIQTLIFEFTVEGSTYLEAKVSTHEFYIALEKKNVICNTLAQSAVELADQAPADQTPQNIQKTELDAQKEENLNCDESLETLEDFYFLMFKPWLYNETIDM